MIVSNVLDVDLYPARFTALDIWGTDKALSLAITLSMASGSVITFFSRLWLRRRPVGAAPARDAFVKLRPNLPSRDRNFLIKRARCVLSAFCNRLRRVISRSISVMLILSKLTLGI